MRIYLEQPISLLISHLSPAAFKSDFLTTTHDLVIMLVDFDRATKFQRGIGVPGAGLHLSGLAEQALGVEDVEEDNGDKHWGTLHRNGETLIRN